MIIIIVFAANLLLLSVYTRLAPALEQRARNRKNCAQRPDGEKRDTDAPKIKPKKTLKQAFVHAVFSVLDHYMYGWMRYNIILTGHIPSNMIRKILYIIVFNAKIKWKTVINGGCEIRSPWNLHAGNCVIMNNCVLDARSGIVIEDDVVFGTGVHIWTEQHDLNSPTFAVTDDNRGPVIIHDHAWICSDSTILPGITVGAGAVLASKACAVRDLEPYGVYAGIPAKKIKERSKDLVYHLSGKPHWHFY